MIFVSLLTDCVHFLPSFVSISFFGQKWKEQQRVQGERERESQLRRVICCTACVAPFALTLLPFPPFRPSQADEHSQVLAYLFVSFLMESFAPQFTASRGDRRHVKISNQAGRGTVGKEEGK